MAIENGEAGEATVLSVRAKMFYLDKDRGSWAERGAGNLKVNVPERCVGYDDDGNAVAASFDASILEDDDDDDEEAGDVPRPKVVRLIMRQDSTHRVILNTAVLPATNFEERSTLKATNILFTAFEGPEAKPVSIQIRVCVIPCSLLVSPPSPLAATNKLSYR